MVSAVLAAAALLGSAPSGCAATTVQYQAPPFSTLLAEAPWVRARPAALGLFGSLVAYPGTLRDPRVNRSDGLVLRRSGAQVFWSRSGTLVARRLDGRGAFRTPLVATSHGALSSLRFPSTGCWRLTVGGGSVVAKVVTPPKQLACAATILEEGQAFARPRSSGIRGGWPWQSSGPAQLTTHGRDGDRNMKVPWWIANGGGSLELVGTRLDAAGAFGQLFQIAGSPDRVYPSIVDVPAAGCWLLRLRTARLAGVLVVRAVDARG
jgi:hypothetical protein